MRALGHAAGYARWRRAAPEPEPGLAASTRTPQPPIVAEALAGGGGWLVPDRVAALLESYGVPHVQSRIVADAGRGRPLRRASSGARSRSRRSLPGSCTRPMSVACGWACRRRPRRRAPRADLGLDPRAPATCPRASWSRAMAPAGAELLVGAVGDPRLRAGGRVRRRRRPSSCSATSQTRLAPLGHARRRRDARARCARTRCWTATAARRRPTCPRWRTCSVRVAALVAAHPEIAELDCNPVIVSPSGASWSTRACGSRRRARRGPIRRSTVSGRRRRARARARSGRARRAMVRRVFCWMCARWDSTVRR